MSHVKGTGRYTLGTEICHAHSRMTGQPCKNKVVYGLAVCPKHGGLGGRHPKHGRYSKAIGKFADAYQSALNDAELLNLKEPIAAMDALAQHSMKRVNELDTPEFRTNVRRRAKAVLVAGKLALNDKEPADEALLKLIVDLVEYADVGCKEDNALRTLAYTLDRLARRMEGAQAIQLAKKYAINARDLVAVMARFLDILRGELDLRVFLKVVDRIDKEVMSRAGGRAIQDVPAEVLQEPIAQAVELAVSVPLEKVHKNGSDG